jgi:hypothetical protein
MTSEDQAASHADLPLRDRVPEYAAVFGAGLAASVVVGFLVGVFSSAGVGDAIGYTVLFLGVVFLLAGGSTGGGYTNMSLGAVGSLFGGRGRIDEDVDDPEARRGARPRLDPRERLRRGLRPEANPRAFWQVIGGFAYVAIGFAVVEWFG